VATSTRTTARKPAEKPSSEAVETPSFAPRPATVTQFRASAFKPNPLAGAVLASKESGPQAIDVTGPDQAKEVVGYLRRDAADNKSGVRILCTDAENKPVKEDNPAVRVVNFQWKQRSKRNYTTDDIRTWHKETYGTELVGKIPADKREEFRKANGYDKTADKQDA
jgi:hypothetical protein